VKRIKHEIPVSILVDTKPEHIDFFEGVYLIKPNFSEFCRMIHKKPGDEIKNTDDDINIH
jgi:bifunctional ADP-heptose synthase (sugar kinase/adenylyltransferase)